MVDTNPRGTERLHEYWVHGEGAAKIRWGSPGDFDRCVLHLGKFIKDPQGYCNLAHKAALGFYPATHAAMEKHGRNAPMGDTDNITRAPLAAAAIDDLPDSDFAYIEPGGTKDSGGKTVPRSKRHFPIHDKTHADNAAARIAQGAEFGKQALPKVQAAQKKFGEGDSGSSRSEMVGFDGFLVRSFPLEDIEILRSGDGRTVSAYAAVFDSEAEIRDPQGHYKEVIDRSAFNRAVDQARPQGSRPYWLTRCFYNHGMTLHGTPSERFSIPLGVTQDVRVESRGLLTVTRYNKTELADEILESIREGSITGQSFTGRAIRSDPTIGRGQRYWPRGGELQTVRRMELGLQEYGPTPIPVYSDAEVVSVRAALANSTYGTAPLDEADPDGMSPAEGDPAEQSPPVPEEEPAAGHDALTRRMAALRATHTDWRK